MNSRRGCVELKTSGMSICCADRCADQKAKLISSLCLCEYNYRVGTEVFVKITCDVGSNEFVKNGVYVAFEGIGKTVVKEK